MSRRPAKFTEADIRRTIRALAKERVEREIRVDPDGSIHILPYVPPPAPKNDTARKDSIRASRIHL